MKTLRLLFLTLIVLSTSAIAGEITKPFLKLHISGDFVSFSNPAGIDEYYGSGTGISGGFGIHISEFNEVSMRAGYYGFNNPITVNIDAKFQAYEFYLDFNATVPGSRTRTVLPFLHAGVGYGLYEIQGLEYQGDNAVSSSYSSITLKGGAGIGFKISSKYFARIGLDYQIITGQSIKLDQHDESRFELWHLGLEFIYDLPKVF